MESDSTEMAATEARIIQVPQYFYAVDINYLTHMIGNANFKQINSKQQSKRMLTNVYI